jgi:hypothetical protein
MPYTRADVDAVYASLLDGNDFLEEPLRSQAHSIVMQHLMLAGQELLRLVDAHGRGAGPSQN